MDSRLLFLGADMSSRTYFLSGNKVVVVKKSYGFLNFLFDSFMVICTGGLWLIWIFVREMRKQ
jgi:hypothetical protein